MRTRLARLRGHMSDARQPERSARSHRCDEAAAARRRPLRKWYCPPLVSPDEEYVIKVQTDLHLPDLTVTPAWMSDLAGASSGDIFSIVIVTHEADEIVSYSAGSVHLVSEGAAPHRLTSLLPLKAHRSDQSKVLTSNSVNFTQPFLGTKTVAVDVSFTTDGDATSLDLAWHWNGSSQPATAGATVPLEPVVGSDMLMGVGPHYGKTSRSAVYLVSLKYASDPPHLPWP